jgi:endoglucanase
VFVSDTPLHGSRRRWGWFRWFLLAVLALALASCSSTSSAPGGGQAPAAAAGMPHVEGSRIVDGKGNPLLLRGAQIESAFNYVKQWQRGDSPLALLNSRTFAVMASWRMNEVRVPLSNWILALDQERYLRLLDQVVQQANAAGLYVVLDLHDDAQSGSPYGKGADFPKAESLAFWKTIASRYRENPMVLFDLFNEPQTPDWQTWLHGGATAGQASPREVGFQDLVDAIRRPPVSARQIIVVEPGGDRRNGWATIGTNTIRDPNIAYSLHVYDGIVQSPQQQDAKWGPLLGHFPLYIGEWALLPNSYTPAQCRGIPHDQADQIVRNFLDYMKSRGASWSAWSFTPGHLFVDSSSYSPTTLDQPWTCGDTHSDAGMGALVKQFLAAGG